MYSNYNDENHEIKKNSASRRRCVWNLIILVSIGLVTFSTVVSIIFLCWKVTPIVQRIQQNTLPGASIISGSVDTPQIRFGAITEDKIANESVTTHKIQNESITRHKLATHSVNEYKLAPDSVTEAKIANGVVTSTKIANQSIRGYHIQNGSLAGYLLQNDTIHTHQIANHSISSVKIQDGAIVTEKLANQSVTNDKIQNYTITPLKINSTVFTKINDSIVDKIESFAICLGSCPTGGRCQPAASGNSYACNCQGQTVYDGSNCKAVATMNMTGAPLNPSGSCSVSQNDLATGGTIVNGYLLTYSLEDTEPHVFKVTFRCSEGGYATFAPYLAVYQKTGSTISDVSDFEKCTYLAGGRYDGGEESSGGSGCLHSPEMFLTIRPGWFYVYVGVRGSISLPTLPFKVMVQDLGRPGVG